MNLAINLVEKGLMPLWLTRHGIRRLNKQRIVEQQAIYDDDRSAALGRFVNRLRQGPIAHSVDSANEQHYELPPAFFEKVLGRHMKYSSCYWPDDVNNLDEAERVMLDLTTTRAGIQDGMNILELGCGWGSLTLWMAQTFPRSQILAVSNSSLQRRHITERCERLGLSNVRVETHDMNEFHADQRFDRIVSVEMFEHMHNYEKLLKRISNWLTPEGRLFVHIFCHQNYAYLFETEGEDNWMGRYFFTGGMMPSQDLLYKFQEDMTVEEYWKVDGTHYQKTAEAWLTNMERHRQELFTILREHYGSSCRQWFERWRIFFMACAELFGFSKGEEWIVGHYLLKPR